MEIVPGFGLARDLYFVQFDFYAISPTEYPSMLVQGPLGVIQPSMEALQPYLNGWGNAGGRLAPTSDDRNVAFKVNAFDVVNVHQVDEPSPLLLMILALLPLHCLRTRRTDQRKEV
jgi:hypothetical protein